MARHCYGYYEWAGLELLMPIYFDETIQDRGDFIVGAYIYGPDPHEGVDSQCATYGVFSS